MSFSMKQVVKALEAVAGAKQPSAGKSKAAKRRAKRKAMKKAGSVVMPTSVPGTSASRSQMATRPAQWQMSHREYLGQIITDTTGVVQGSIFLAPDSLPWLGGLSKSFEKYQWRSLVLEYVPDVGTTKDGSVALGIDWADSSASSIMGKDLLSRDVCVRDTKYKRADVVAFTPSGVTPLWKPLVIRLPAAMLQSRKWYDSPKAATTSSDVFEKGPGYLAYYCNAPASTTVGDIWVTYTVVFAGTRKA